MNEDLALEESVSRFLSAWLRARQLIQAANFNRFQKAGLSATQFMTLNLIPAGNSGTTLSELARSMNLGAATLTKTVDSLEARGLLLRTRSNVDRRQVLLTLTRTGSNLQNSASAEFHSQMAALFRKMTPAQRKGLVSGLEGLLHANSPESRNPTDAPASPAKRRTPQSPKPKS